MISRIVTGIGWMLFAVGVSCADSENLLIPTALTFVGILLMYKESIGKY